MSEPVIPTEDDLVFIDETTPAATPAHSSDGHDVWRVMIVDDDADVHSATTFALGNLDIQNLISEARELLLSRSGAAQGGRV